LGLFIPKKDMQPIKFNIVNLRNLSEDGLDLNFAITSSNGPLDPASFLTSNAAIPGGIQMNVSYPLTVFTGDTMEIGMDFINSGRLYFGYGELPSNVSGSTAPTPEGNQYYGWIEFSRMAADMCLWINLSNVDIVGLPIALSSSTWSLGYKNSNESIINDLMTSYPGCEVLCNNGKYKIVAPGINHAPYPSFDSYLGNLYNAGASLCINSDTLSDGTQKIFSGYFLQDPEQCICLESNSGDTLVITNNNFNNDIVYKGDGGTLIYNFVEVAQNRSGSTDDVITTNSVFRNLVIGMNEGYFDSYPAYSDGTNYSVNYSYLKPFGDNGDKGSMYAKTLHNNSNSYGFAYSDSNLKTLIQGPLSALTTLYILQDSDGSGLCYKNDEKSTQNSPGYGWNHMAFGDSSNSLGNITIGNCNYPATTNATGTGGFLPYVDGFVKMNFEGVGQYIWINTKTLDISAVDISGNTCLTGAMPVINPVCNSASTVVGAQLTWGSSIEWNSGSGNAVDPN